MTRSKKHRTCTPLSRKAWELSGQHSRESSGWRVASAYRRLSWIVMNRTVANAFVEFLLTLFCSTFPSRFIVRPIGFHICTCRKYVYIGSISFSICLCRFHSVCGNSAPFKTHLREISFAIKRKRDVLAVLRATVHDTRP